MFGIQLQKFNPLSGRGREVVSIDMSGSTLKIAHVKSTATKKEVVNLLSRNISGLPDDEIPKVIRASYNELKVKNPAIVTLVPSHLAITKNIEIPSVNPQEIREIINLQAGRHTPYSREEIIVGYIDIGTYKRSYTKILLVIVARAVVKKQFDMLERVGLRSSRVFFAPEGLAHILSKVSKSEAENLPTIVVHIDEDVTDFIIVLRERAAFIRSIPIGARHLTDEKERYQAKFAEELKRSLEAYQSEDIDRSPTTLVLTGAVQESKDLEPVLNDTLRMPIRVIPYLRNLQISVDAFKAASGAKRASFLHVIAPLLVWEKMRVNLIPEEVKLRKVVEERGRDLIKTGILVLTLFVLVLSLLMSRIFFASAYLKKLSAKYQALQKETQALEKDYTRASLVRSYLMRRGCSLEVLTELYDSAPLELEFSDIKFDNEQARFSLKGTAQSMSAVFFFVDNMVKSKHFKDVKTKYTTKRKEGPRDVVDFEVNCVLKKELER
jgi:Tfp pilus assembly PilM family ATPase/Tfp pilus assembly protein PilN